MIHATGDLLEGSLDFELGAKDGVMSGLRMAQEQASTSVYVLIGSAALALVSSLGLGLLVAMPLASRLSRVRDGAGEIGRGNLNARIKEGSRDEIGQLATAFNEMAAGLSLSRDESCENETRFKELAEAIREVFWVTSADTSVIHYVSPAYEEIWGRSCASIYENPMSFVDGIHPEDRPRVLKTLEQKKSEAFEHEYRVVRPDGTVRWIYDRGFPIRDHSGHVTRVVGIAEDITSRKIAEAALRQSEAMLARAQQVAKIGSWDWDIRTGQLLWSDEYFRILDLHAGEFTPSYEAVLNRIHPEDQPRVKGAVERALSGEEAYCVDYRITARDGSIRMVLAQGDVDRDGAGKPIRMVGTALDVTDRKTAEQALRAAHEGLEQRVEERTAALVQANDALQESEAALQLAKSAAEAANLAKSDFLANMSHEIRTPMTAILGYSDMLLAPERSSSERLDCVHIIRREGEHLLTILNDILDLSKIEAGKMQVEQISCSPVRVVNEAVSLMRVRAIEKAIRLTVTFVGPLPESVQTDPTRLRQILINLIGNSIKFTEAGAVQVVVSLDHEAPDSDARLRFEVIDSGIGMTPDQIAQIFQPFTQGDASTTRRFGGTGLGLAICRRLAQMLGGEITVRSIVGCGSRFIVTIAAGSLQGAKLVVESQEAVDEVGRRSHGKARNEVPESVSLSGRVLLAEDGVHNQRVIAFYLQQAGVQVSIADNGRIACEMALAASESAQPFDLVLMDMQMPEMDGYEAAAKLRNKGFDRPIVALTAHAMSQDREKCLKAGCADYLTKPIDREVLLETVARHLNHARETNAMTPTVTPTLQAGPQLRSSLIDESEMARFLSSFVADLPAMVSQLQTLLKEDDMEQLQGAIHQIKGTGGIYGFLPLTEAATRVEQALIGNTSVETAQADVNALIDLIRSVEGYEASREGELAVKEQS
jgi:PAS domain S-box-containing protein